MSVKDWTNLKLIDTLIVETLAISTGQGANRVALEVHDEIMLRLNQAPPPCSECATLPAKWHEDSSLETWFPLTAEELKRTKERLAGLEQELLERTTQRNLAREARENWKGRAEAAEAQLSTLGDALERPPDGYAYRYPDNCIRFNEGYSINGCDPIAQIPYWFEPPKIRAALAPTPEVAPKEGKS